MPKDIRRHERLLIPNGRDIHVECPGPTLKGLVTVIGLGGMFIRTKDSQPYGTVLPVKVADPLVTFEAECTVRNVVQNGLGVEITEITAENEQKLKTLVLYLKP